MNDDLMTPAEVAAVFRVDAKTVTRWANMTDPLTEKPRLPSIRTIGGHRRFRRADVEALINWRRDG